MYKYFNVFIFAILAAGIQDVYGNSGNHSQPVVLELNDNDFPDYDILKIIIEEKPKNNEYHKKIVVYINEKMLIVDSYNDGIDVSLTSIKPTYNGGWPPLISSGDKVYELIYKKDSYFDILEIIINKINGVRSEKTIKIFINDKIVSMNTTGNAINLYIQHRKDDNTTTFIQKYNLNDSDGASNSVNYSTRKFHSVSYNLDQSTEKNKGNNSNVKRVNDIILLCFGLWNLIP
ncbi:uncharacterized protein LOC123262706 [Cotesia glomerata]|uniref:uncharacterized protein LOC123262706 n=1 Tax=Cotesia glomerata TaxID=32391 RepID=UPI001D01319F|nr:uncharacterized protein LOC123262706 [Cotesia glomerata]